MKTVAAGAFKANCLAIMDEVKAKREPVLITKYGKPVAKLVPVEQGRKKDLIFGFMVGEGTINGDIISPIVPPEDWEDAV
ncbi:MAG: type II toxin-antitoxin system Phd/YefM family antitoxin, partial [Acidobacteriaceae bacterium]